MNEIDIRLDCERYTKYSNLINKGDEIICPECSKHKVNISETFKISINREKILRKEVELFFEKLELNNLNDCISVGGRPEFFLPAAVAAKTAIPVEMAGRQVAVRLSDRPLKWPSV